MHWTWLVLLVPGLFAQSWVGVLPALVLLGVIALANRRRWRVRFELEGLRFLSLITMVSPVALIGFLRLMAGKPVEELPISWFMLGLASVTLQASASSSEFTSKTASTWLAQPLSLSRLVFEKWAVAAGVSVCSLAQIELIVRPSAPDVFFVGPMLACVLGGFTVPLALVFKETLAAAFLSLLAVLVPVMGMVTLCGDLEHPDAADPWVAAVCWALPVVSALSGWVSTRRARALLLVSVPEARSVEFSPGRTSALRALVMKELRLQGPAVGLMAGMVLLWSLTRGEPRTAVTLLLGLVVAALAGITPTMSEKQYGTQVTELALLPSRWVWRVKTVVSSVVTLVGGVALPGALLLLSAGPEALLGRSPIGAMVNWSLVVAAVFTLGLASAAVFHELKNAFAFVVAGAQVLFFTIVFSTVFGHFVGGWLGEKLGWFDAGEQFKGVMSVVTFAAPALALVQGALFFARRSLSADLPRSQALNRLYVTFGSVFGSAFVVSAINSVFIERLR